MPSESVKSVFCRSRLSSNAWSATSLGIASGMPVIVAKVKSRYAQFFARMVNGTMAVWNVVRPVVARVKSGSSSKNAWVRSQPSKIVPCRMAPRKSVFTSNAPVRSAPVRSAPVKIVPLRLACIPSAALNFAAARCAPAYDTEPRMEPLKMAPSIWAPAALLMVLRSVPVKSASFQVKLGRGPGRTGWLSLGRRW